MEHGALACMEACTSCMRTFALRALLALTRAAGGAGVFTISMWALVQGGPSGSPAATWAWAANWSSYSSVAADADDRLSSLVGSAGAALAAGAFSELPAARDAQLALASFARSGVMIPKVSSPPAGCLESDS